MLFAIITNGSTLKGLFTNATNASKYVSKGYENDTVNYWTEIFAVDVGETIQLDSKSIAFFSTKKKGQGNYDHNSTEDFEYDEEEGLKYVFVVIDEEGFFSVFYSERKARQHKEATEIYKVKVNCPEDSLLTSSKSKCIKAFEAKSFLKELEEAIFSANYKIFDSYYAQCFVKSKDTDFVKYIDESLSTQGRLLLIKNVKEQQDIVSELAFEYHNHIYN